MTNTDLGLLNAAVQLLLYHPDAALHYQAMRAVRPLADKYGVHLHGEAEALNALLDMARSDPAKLDAILLRIDERRVANGLPALAAGGEAGGWNKTEYQKLYMAEMRERTLRAARIENAKRPERDRLIGRAREDFRRKTSRDWGAEVDERVRMARDAAGVGRLPKKVGDVIRDQFWAEVDARLDQAEAEIRQTPKRR